MGFPLLVQSVRLAMQLVDARLENAARTLGASPLVLFASVTLPLALPGILVGALLTFSRSLGEFGATITFVSNIPGETRTGIKIVDAATNAKLKVSFFGPFYGDYWVLDHAEDYSWSIVGEPSGRYLWLLSRAAKPGQARLDQLIARAGALGYDTSMLRITQQP